MLVSAHMVNKRVQFDDETWAAIEAVANESGRSFQEVADEAFAALRRSLGRNADARSLPQIVFPKAIAPMR